MTQENESAPRAAGRREFVVVGAGAAGVGAARTLRAAGADVLVLEARERLGGRVWTRHDLAPVPLELGAEYIHTDYTALAGLAAASGLPRRETAVGAPPRPFEFDDPDLEALLEAARAEGPRGGEDLEAWTARTPAVPERWRSLLSRALARDEPHRLDARMALEELGRYRRRGQQLGDRDTVLPGGFGALLEHLASGLDIRRGSVVSAIRTEGDGTRVTVRAGARTHDVLAGAVVLAVPLGVLKAADIVVDPPLPEPYRRAIAEIGLLDVFKAVMVADLPRSRLPVDLEERMSRSTGVDFWLGAGGADSEAPVVVSAFAAGRVARELLALDESARRRRTVETFRRTTGIEAPVTVHSHLWAADPYSRGAYSAAPPGMSEQARRRLAEPVDGGRLVLVGEALHEELPRTVGGAWESGVAGAEILLSLR